MYIESIQLKNFRNYQTLDLQFDKGTNIFYGDNAQGKTNILEAAYICGTSKSHKGSRDKELIRFGEEEAHIRMHVRKENIPYRIDMHLKKNKSKGIAINGIPIKKVRELLGIVNLVVFSPEDLGIIKNGPEERRRFMDMELCQLSPIYLSNLTDYTHILNQRNKLLKDIGYDQVLQSTLDIWDEQYIKYGKGIIESRKEFIYEVNKIAREIHKNLTGKKEEIDILYEPNVEEENFEKMMLLNRERDLRLKSSSIGPHRDDLCVRVNGIDIRKFGSQGQQRTAALSLKLSELTLVRNRIKDTPILLLDDVLSELDSNRQNYLLDSLSDIQTMVTCTGLDDFVNSKFTMNKIFQVVNGSVK